MPVITECASDLLLSSANLNIKPRLMWQALSALVLLGPLENPHSLLSVPALPFANGVTLGNL